MRVCVNRGRQDVVGLDGGAVDEVELHGGVVLAERADARGAVLHVKWHHFEVEAARQLVALLRRDPDLPAGAALGIVVALCVSRAGAACGALGA